MKRYLAWMACAFGLGAAACGSSNNSGDAGDARADQGIARDVPATDVPRADTGGGGDTGGGSDTGGSDTGGGSDARADAGVGGDTGGVEAGGRDTGASDVVDAGGGRDASDARADVPDARADAGDGAVASDVSDARHTSDAGDAGLRLDVAVDVPVSGCRTNSECGSTRYCRLPVGTCSGVGECDTRPEVCLADYVPVCGCNGDTYSNDCVAATRGANLRSLGECP